MGFGLLFLGYVFSIDMLTLNLLFPTCALMYYALCKLSFVNLKFSKAKYFLLPLMGIGIASIILLWIPSLNGTDIWYAYCGAVAKICMAGFLLTLLRGVREISVELSLKGLEIRAFRNQIYTLLCYVPTFFLEFSYSANYVFLKYLSVLFVFIWLVVYALNARLLFDCYRVICMPEDLDMPQKPSRFSAVNAYRAKKEEAENAALQAEQERRKARQTKKKRG